MVLFDPTLLKRNRTSVSPQVKLLKPTSLYYYYLCASSALERICRREGAVRKVDGLIAVPADVLQPSEIANTGTSPASWFDSASQSWVLLGASNLAMRLWQTACCSIVDGRGRSVTSTFPPSVAGAPHSYSTQMQNSIVNSICTIPTS